jgi:hypothetical protein
VLDRALSIAEALELPDVLSSAAARQATLFQTSGRPMEARMFLEGAVAIAEEHGLTDELQIALTNLGDVMMNRDLPGAREHSEASLFSARRLGNRALESLAACNVMLVDLFAGRWEEVERLGRELLEEGGEDRPDSEFIHERIATLAVLRGDLPAAKRGLERLRAWEDSGDIESGGSFATLSASIAVAEGRPEEALARATDLVRSSIGRGEENARLGWPVVFDAALSARRLEEAAGLTGLLDELPPGQVPPYLRAQLNRGLGLLAAARGDHDVVEPHLSDAIELLRSLGYPYWLARAQTDLAAWLVDQGRAPEAVPLRDEAVAALEPLGAAPALARARALLAPEPTAVDA